MARTVADAVALLEILVGADKNDAITMSAQRESNYARFLDKDGLRGARLGVASQYFGKNARVDRAMQANLKTLESCGAQLFEVKFPYLDEIGGAEMQVLLSEFKHDLNRYLATRGGEYDLLAKIIAFNSSHADAELFYFGQELLIEAQAQGGLDVAEYRAALEQSKNWAGAQGIDAALDKDDLDAIVAPTNSPAWPIDLIGGDNTSSDASSSTLAAVAGTPSITVPASFACELPLGISFFGRAFSEPTLIRVAHAWEQATRARRRPRFLATYV